MTQKSKIYIFLILFLSIGMSPSTDICAQQILDVTEIPYFIVVNSVPDEIKILDGKVIVPIYKADNRIYQYLPHVEIDSFDSPNDFFSLLDNTVRSTLYVEYEPFVGFLNKDILNYFYEKDLSIKGNYIAYAGTTSFLGIKIKVYDELLLVSKLEKWHPYYQKLKEILDNTEPMYDYQKLFPT